MTAALTAAEARRAARNAGALAAARILSSGALFVWQLILARLLGDQNFGVYSTVGGLFSVGASLASFGMGILVIRDLARRPDLAGRYWSALLFTQTILALLAYVGVNGAAWAFDYPDAIRAYVAIAALSLFIDTLGSIGYDQLLAQERMVSPSIVEVCHVVARIALAGGALALGFGLLGVYLVTLATGVGRGVLLWGLLRSSGVRPHWPLDRAVVRALLINAAPLALSAFISMTYTQIDKLMTTSLLTAADTGHLSAAFVIVVGAVEVLSTTVLVAVYPLMSRAYGSALFPFLVEKLAFFTLLIVVPMALVCTLFAAEFAVPLFGEDFRPTADVLRVLIWYAALTMVANVLAQSLMVQNRQRRLVLLRAGGLLGKLALNALLLPRVGVIGAALASALAEAGVLALLITDWRMTALTPGPALSGRGAADGADSTRSENASGGGAQPTAPAQPHAHPNPDPSPNAERGEMQHAGLISRLARLAAVALAAVAAMVMIGAAAWWLGILVGLGVYAVGVLRGSILSDDDRDLLYRLIAAAPGGHVLLKFWKRPVTLNW